MQSYSEHLLSSSIARRDAAEEREEQGAAYGNNNHDGKCWPMSTSLLILLAVSAAVHYCGPATPHKPIAVPGKAFAQPHLKGGNFGAANRWFDGGEKNGHDIITTAYLESPLVDSGVLLANSSSFSQIEEFSAHGDGDGGEDQGYADPGSAEAWHGVQAGSPTRFFSSSALASAASRQWI